MRLLLSLNQARKESIENFHEDGSYRADEGHVEDLHARTLEWIRPMFEVRQHYRIGGNRVDESADSART